MRAEREPRKEPLGCGPTGLAAQPGFLAESNFLFRCYWTHWFAAIAATPSFQATGPTILAHQVGCRRTELLSVQF
jgi:hypothetical protein